MARGWQWVDPEGEVAAYKEAIKAGFTTISDVVALTGEDVEDVFKQRRRELDLAEQMDLKFDTEWKDEEGQGEKETEEQGESEDEGVDLQSLFGGNEDRSIEELPHEEKRARNCKKGKACGNSCISKNKTCRKNLSPAATSASNNPVAKNAQKTGTSTTVNNGEGLATAIANRDFKAAIDLGDKVYQGAKQRATASGQDFYSGIAPGNGSIEDWILKELWSDRGFDRQPQTVTAKQFNTLANNGDVVAYRAMGSSPARFTQHFNNFKTGDYFAGHGIYGHGTYVAWANGNDQAARSIARSYASQSASGYGSGLMRMNLSGMRIGTQSAQQRGMQKFEQDFDSWAQQERNNVSNQRAFDRKVRRTKTVMFGDSIGGEGSGRFATLQGYDAIKLDASYNSSYMILLNRSKVKVQKTKIKKNST